MSARLSSLQGCHLAFVGSPWSKESITLVLEGEAAAGQRPLVTLLDQEGSDQADDGSVVGKMPTTSERRAISASTGTA